MTIKIISLNNHSQCEWPKCSHKIHRVADRIKRHDPSICFLQESHFEPKDTFRLKVKGWNTIFHPNGPQKKSEVAILITARLDFKLKTAVRDTEGRYIILKGCIQQVDMTILNIYAPTREQQDTQANF